MSFATSDEAKERIRQAVDIVDLVGDYLQLRREGRGYKALCPWHDDSRPSLQVNPERQSFRCWVCDIGGDIFSFVMKIENVGFREALELLADRAGIRLAPASAGGARSDDKRILYQAAAWAEQQFHDCLLHAPEAEAARAYLAQRGLTPESIRAFRLGFSPDQWQWLAARTAGTPFTQQVLEQIGLLVPREGGKHYDRFRGRVLFSIRDPQGRPVALGGRILPSLSEQNPAKYINSPESPLFSKSRMLYGLDLAKDALLKSGTALVMEGYTDCILAHQCGFPNAVAVLGTALGQRHIHLLRRYAQRVVLVLDGDEAGRRRADEVLALFIAEQVDLRILTLPDSLDPCDFLLSRGPQALAALVEQSVDAVEHKFRAATAGLSAGSQLHRAQQAIEEVLATLAKAPLLQPGGSAAFQLKEDQVLHRLAQRFSVGEARLRSRLHELRRGGRRPATSEVASIRPSRVEQSPRRRLAERWLLEILLWQPDLLDQVRHRLPVECLADDGLRTVYAALLALGDQGRQPTFERLLLALDDPGLKSLVVALDEDRRAKGRADARHELRDLLQVLTEAQETADTAAPDETRSGQDDASDRAERLRRIIERQRLRHGISPPTEGQGAAPQG